MQRYKILLQYDGTNYFGWQLQPEQVTIQGELERALAVLNAGQRVIVVGAGRTDTGVHARGQVAHFDLETCLSPDELGRAINGNLPYAIRVRSCELTNTDFHARYSAKQRKYQYFCRTDDNVIAQQYFWPVQSVDINLLHECAQDIIGEYDFTAFSKTGQEQENRCCKVYESTWNESATVLNFTVVANRFLHHMVRYLVGTMVAVGQGSLALKDFRQLIDHPREDVRIYRAPAGALVLQEVSY